MFTRRSCLAAVLALPLAAAFAAAAEKMTFEVYADAKDEFRWRLLDGDGKNVANSGQGYSKKADCTKMVENFKNDISRYTFEVYEDNKKEQRFRLKARNGNVVGSSTSSFKTKAEAEKAIAAIKSGVKDATVKEVEKDKK
jgi:uncharacterized protein YegP (UPF0339 family)